MITITSNNQKFVYSSFTERYTAEKSGIKIFSNYDFTDITGFEQFDATCEVAGKKAIVEYKVRRNASNRYPSVMIEKKKFVYLINKHKETGSLPIYQCFYNDSYALIFDLRKCLDVPVEKMVCPKYTSNPSAGTIVKDVINIPTGLALRIRYNKPLEAEIEKSFYSQFKVI